VSLSCGIDFGTSNTTLTLNLEGRVEQVVLEPESLMREAMPSLMYFDLDALSSYGSRAVAAYEADDMAGRFLQAIKKHLPSPEFAGTIIADRAFTIEELVAGFLEKLKVAADRAAGTSVDQVLMGRPARFHTDPARDALAQARLERAATMAGFVDVAFQLEPIAAARSYERELDRDVLCLVGDLGGGTSDFTLIRLGPSRLGGDRREDVLGVDGVYVGGTDFDARLIWAKVVQHLGIQARYKPSLQWLPVPRTLHYACTRWHTLCFANTIDNLAFLERVIRTADDQQGLENLYELIDENYAWPFFRAVENTKFELSHAAATELVFEQGRIAIGERVTREEFEHAIADELATLETTIDTLLEGRGLGWDDVGVVFLTGGSSKVPCVRRIFDERFGGRIVERDAFASVGLGLGGEAGERFA